MVVKIALGIVLGAFFLFLVRLIINNLRDKP
jgi:hypothetical protein